MMLMTTTATLCWILNGNEALLKLANRDINIGKWNAPGGKVQSNESAEQCARREVFEETGLKLNSLTHHGIVNFFFGSKPSPDWTVHVFSSKSFSGKLKESKEGKIKWFSVESLPFDNMWEDDQHWVPLMLTGRRFVGTFYYTEDGSKLLSFDLEEKEET